MRNLLKKMKRILKQKKFSKNIIISLLRKNILFIYKVYFNFLSL